MALPITEQSYFLDRNAIILKGNYPLTARIIVL